MLNIDYRIFEAINGWAGHSGRWDGIMEFLSNDGEYLFFIGILVYWLTRSDKNRRMVVEALTAACAAMGIGAILSSFFYRDRPFVHYHVHLLIRHAANASFPSDHATAAFAVATAVWLNRRTDGSLWLLIAAGISFSRIWTGVHYPLDVISGVVLGMTSTLAVHAFFKRSARAKRWLAGGIAGYERLEHKVWPSKGLRSR